MKIFNHFKRYSTSFFQIASTLRLVQNFEQTIVGEWYCSQSFVDEVLDAEELKLTHYTMIDSYLFRTDGTGKWSHDTNLEDAKCESFSYRISSNRLYTQNLDEQTERCYKVEIIEDKLIIISEYHHQWQFNRKTKLSR